LRTEGEDELTPQKETSAACDKVTCNYSDGKHSIILVKKYDNEALDRACQQKADILIAWRYLHSYRCTGPSLLIGRAELEASGAHALRFGKDGLQVLQTRQPGQKKRIWQPILAKEQDDDD
jgi:hypothetical protein